MGILQHWLTGELSQSERLWSSLSPGLVLVAYFLIGLAPYLLRYRKRGAFRDADIERRGSSFLVGMAVRQYFAWVSRPVWGVVLKSGVPPTAVTTLSVLLAVGAGVAMAAGRFALGGWLYLASGLCDFLDGRLARATQRVSRAGSALDSILDRYSESAVLLGLMWFYRDSWVLVLAALALMGSSLVPYIRAKGEALGVQGMAMGLMQRPERLVYLGLSVALSPVLEALLDPGNPHPLHHLAVLGLLLLAVSTQLTAARRLSHLLQTLSDEPRPKATLLGRNGMGRNLTAGAVATALDAGLVLALVSWLGMSPWLATALGCGLGGVVNFAINHRWAFESERFSLRQVLRYGITSLSSAFLNSGGVAVLLLLPELDYRPAWLLTRVAVYLAWNYPLHRDYVFSPQATPPAAPEPAR